MTNFAFDHVATAYPGRPAWIGDAAFHTYDRPRGCVAVDDGDKTRFYRVSRRDRRAFKAWAQDAFSINCSRLTGAWPNYSVRQPG